MAIGTIIDGRYEILSQLGSGGMGVVYRARRVLLGDDVALKMMKAGDASLTDIDRFLRESRTLAQLRHPNIITVYDFNRDADGRPFLVMEYLNGPSLRQEQQAAGRLDLGRVAEIFSSVCKAVHAAHERGVVHRDLKPENIINHRFGSGDVIYKVIDFGIAHLRSGEETRLTGVSQFVGTVAFAAPEQVRGEVPEAAADIYSLGAIAFELLTGAPPFAGENPITMLMRRLQEEPPLPSAIRADLPSDIDAILMRALARKAGDRWSTAVEFAEALAAAAPGGGRTAAPSRASAFALKYAIGPLLATGRFGSQVFAATHRDLGHPVAVRILHRDNQPNWDVLRARTLKEARTLQIVHPSIIQVRDFGEEGDMVYVVTDIVEGESLRQLLRRERTIPWPRLSTLASQMVDAAAALHRRAAVLCGLTPEIIRLTRDDDGERLMISSSGVGHVKDVLANLPDQALRGRELECVELPYLAPELLMGKSPDVRSDVYALGVLIYEMASGALPFSGASLPELLGAALQGRAPDPRALNPSLPEDVAAVIMQCLDRDPEKRYATAHDLLSDLERLRDQ